MYTINKIMMNQLSRSLKALIITLVIPQLVLAQYNEPTYDRKPTAMFVELKEEASVSSFEVYPAKTDGELNIVLGDFIGQSVEILIQDNKGNTVLHQRIDELNIGLHWLDLNDYDLANGKYTLTVVNSGNSFNAETVFTRKK